MHRRVPGKFDTCGKEWVGWISTLKQPVSFLLQMIFRSIPSLFHPRLLVKSLKDPTANQRALRKRQTYFLSFYPPQKKQKRKKEKKKAINSLIAVNPMPSPQSPCAVQTPAPISRHVRERHSTKPQLLPHHTHTYIQLPSSLLHISLSLSHSHFKHSLNVRARTKRWLECP